MRRVALPLALILGLGGWIAAGVVTTTPREAAAQSPPPIVIERDQDAGFVPARSGNRPLFVAVLGSDARPGEQVDRRLADSIHIIAVNQDLKGATIIGIPRDSYVPIPGVGQRRINDALFYGGPELVVDTIEQLTGLPIDYWMLTSFEGVRRMVGAIGGLRVDIPYAMNDAASGADFEPGPQRLDGGQTLALARNRKSTPDGDFSRSENQGLILMSALDAFRKGFAKDPITLFRWIAVGLTHIQTDLSIEEILELGLTALQIKPSDVTNMVLPGGTADVGGASVVVLSDAASSVYADVLDDGLLNNR